MRLASSRRLSCQFQLSQLLLCLKRNRNRRSSHARRGRGILRFWWRRLQSQAMPQKPHNEVTASLGFRVAGLVAVGWVTVLALLYLVRYSAWALPFQLWQLAGASLPNVRIGSHFGQFVLGRLADIACVAAILATALALGAIAISR